MTRSLSAWGGVTLLSDAACPQVRARESKLAWTSEWCRAMVRRRLTTTATTEDSARQREQISEWRWNFMIEALVIIVALGGLEIVLWHFDHKQQKKVVELLDSIWAELAIRNSAEDDLLSIVHH